MEIHQAGKEDIPLIKNLAEVIWPEVYTDIISAAQIHYMLGLIYSEDALATQLENGHQFIIASKENVPIGFASYSKKSEEEPYIFRLHKIYVLPRQHGQGIGSALLEHIYHTARNKGASQIELNVNKYNIAKEFYLKKGYAILKEEIIDIGGGYVMDDYVMGKKLQFEN